MIDIRLPDHTEAYIKSLANGNPIMLDLLMQVVRLRLREAMRRGRRQDQYPSLGQPKSAFIWFWGLEQQVRHLKIGEPCNLWGLEDLGLVMNIAHVPLEFESRKHMEIWISATALIPDHIEIEREALSASSFWSERMGGLGINKPDFPPIGEGGLEALAQLELPFFLPVLTDVRAKRRRVA